MVKGDERERRMEVDESKRSSMCEVRRKNKPLLDRSNCKRPAERPVRRRKHSGMCVQKCSTTILSTTASGKGDGAVTPKSG